MKRYLVPVVAGVTVFGAATAFAAALTVNSETLGSGNDTVTSCSASAAANYDGGGTYSAATPYGYKVAVVNVSSAAGCAGLDYKVTLTGAANASLAERTGTLSSAVGFEGTATPDFSAANVEEALVTGISIVITG